MERQLVEHFVTHELVSRQEMQRCILRASMEKTSVLEQLISVGKVDEVALAERVAEFYGHEFFNAPSIKAQANALKLISAELAAAHGVLPFSIEPDDDLVTVAVIDPQAALDVLESIKIAMGKSPRIVVVPRSIVLREIDRHYRGGDAPPKSTSFGILKRPGLNKPGRSGATDEPSGDQQTREVLVSDSMIGFDGGLIGVDQDEKTRAVDLFEFDDELSADAMLETPSPPHASEVGEVEGALSRFDAFLDETSDASGIGTSTGRNVNLFYDRESFLGSGSESFDEHGFGALNSSQALSLGHVKQPNRDRTDFDLFGDEVEEPEGELTLQQLVEKQHRALKRLEREVEHQRNVIHALADLLVENRVIGKKKLKDRLRALRKP